MPRQDPGEPYFRVDSAEGQSIIAADRVRSGLACEMVGAMGYDSENLYNIDDGTPSWIAGGHPTSYGEDD